jgi:DNA-binding XRE family transcriptional regulator
MERRGYNRSSLAAVLEVTPTMVGYWRAGRYLPQPYIAERMADTLDDAMLRAMVVQARTFRCGHCGKTFDRQQTRATYCSTACQRRAHGPGGKRFDPRQDAIDAMCRGCEPEGMCRDDACALRPFSPFLFVSLTRPRRAA